MAGDGPAARRWLLPECALDPGFEARLAVARPERHRLVAVACLGSERMVRQRLEGAGGAVTVTARWAPGEAGWRLAALRWTAPDPGAAG